MENRFKVVYSGELQPYVSAQEAVRNIAALFKVSEDRSRALVLGGRACDIKVGLDQAAAERYVSALSKAGLTVRIQPMVAAKLELELSPLGLEETSDALPGTSAGPCPKCGAAQVHGGVSGACGAAVPAYRTQPSAGAPSLAGHPTARAAGVGPDPETRVHDPYAGAQAEPRPAPRGAAGEERLTGPHALPAGHGWGWISRGFWHFREAPWTWVLITLAYSLIVTAVSLVPILGGMAVYLSGPIVAGGVMLGAHDQDQGKGLGFHHLFAGFSNHGGRLLVVGLMYLVGVTLATLPVMLLLVLPILAGMEPTMIHQDPWLMADALGGRFPAATLVLAGLVAVLLTLPVAMAYWFAPALIAIDGMRPWQAMKLSLVGCLKNVMPLVVYGLMGGMLIVLGSLPMLLGLLVVMPTLAASIYVSYRDIFYRKV
jgi:uncharacterized membrane protein